MNELILAKMRAGDWGEVVRLMREEYGPTPGPSGKKERSDMPFRERFDTVRVTPLKVAESVVEENGRFSGVEFDGELNTHHGTLLKNGDAANGLLGDFYAKNYDLEEMYPHAHPASGYYLRGIDFGEEARG